MTIPFKNTPRICGLTCKMDDRVQKAFASFLTDISSQRSTAEKQGT